VASVNRSSDAWSQASCTAREWLSIFGTAAEARVSRRGMGWGCGVVFRLVWPGASVPISVARDGMTRSDRRRGLVRELVTGLDADAGVTQVRPSPLIHHFVPLTDWTELGKIDPSLCC
jgi:hypothetical protein